MRAEAGDVRLVEGGESIHVGQETQRLCHVAQLCTSTFKMVAQVDDCLRRLCLDATFDETSLTKAKLPRDDDPIACSNDGCVRSNWCSHAFKARRTASHYPFHVGFTSRRVFLQQSGQLLLGTTVAATTATLLGACRSTTGEGALPPDVQIVQRFPQNLVVGSVRIPISLASGGGLLTTSGDIATPDELTARIMRIDGEREELVIQDLVAVRHDANLATPYWPFRANIDTPGFYRLVLDDGPSDGAAFQVAARGEVLVPGIGDRLPPFDTPTFTDAQGVEPICTRQPEPCPLHDITLREALTLGKPIVYLVGTPAHCATGTCAPALEAIVAAASRVGSTATFLHAEIYSDSNATTVAPAVNAVSMNYEPAVFVTDENGVVVARLDAVFDEVELQSIVG